MMRFEITFSFSSAHITSERQSGQCMLVEDIRGSYFKIAQRHHGSQEFIQFRHIKTIMENMGIVPMPK